jgi:hypothetical protein
MNLTEIYTYILTIIGIVALFALGYLIIFLASLVLY